MKHRNRITTWIKSGLAVLIFSVGCMVWHSLAVAQSQDADAVVFPSGHWLDDTYGFLTYWRTHNGEKLLGAPVTGPLQEHGIVVQYFERGRLELHASEEGSRVFLGRVGYDYASALWLAFQFEAPALQKPQPGDSFAAISGERSAHLPDPNEKYFAETGFAINEPFLGFWQQYGGVETFGYPISQPIWGYVDDELLLVQYFERARLERHTIGQNMYDVRMSSLGRDLALLRGYDMTPPDPGNRQLIEVRVPEHPTEPIESLPTPTPTLEPTPTPAQVASLPPAPALTMHGVKYIVVNLSQQWLYAYEGETLVFDAPVSTGRDGFNTPVGTFSIYAKIPLQTMSGTIGGESYYVPNVPHAMYIYGGVAMHGTYWHNQFGTGVRMSHGCINLPQESAAWLYEWAPVGTTVYVRY